MDRRKSGSAETADTQAFFLVRHGSLGLTEKLYLGQTDLPLAPEGWEEARALGKWFVSNHCHFDRIHVSPLRRCVQTLDGILDGMSLSPDAFDIRKEPDLAEINLGDWDGRPVREIMRQYPEEYEARGKSLLTYRTPGGESFEALRRRAVSCFLRIMSQSSQSGQALIVAHAGVNRMILQECMSHDDFEISAPTCDYISAPHDSIIDFMQIPQPPASCYRIHKKLY